MPRWQPFNAVGGAYSDDCKPWTVQDTVNYLPVAAERGGTRSPSILRQAPGYVAYTSLSVAPLRGLHDVEGFLVAVAGTTMYKVVGGTATAVGVVPGVGRVTFAHNQITNGHEVAIANGQSGYVYNTVTGAFVQITDAEFPGFKVVDFIDQFIVGVEPNGRYWFNSDAANALSYSSLDQQDAEAAPDRIVSLIVTGDDVLVFGARTGQFFYADPAEAGTFLNRDGVTLNVGIASPWCASRLDNTVYWLGDDGIVYRLNGYSAQRISTHAVEQAIAKCDTSQAFSFTFEDRGHKVFYLTLPDGQTWGFDASSGEIHRRQSTGLMRWRISALVKSNRAWIAGDYVNGQLYQLDWDASHENGEELERLRVTGVLSDHDNAFIINGIRFMFDTGLSKPIPLAIEGDLADGTVGVAYSSGLTAVYGVPPYGPWSIIAGSLPPGLSMSTSTGLVTGTPT